MARKRAEAEATGAESEPASEAAGRAADEVPVSGREPGDDVEQYTPEANPRPWAQNSLAGVQFRTHRDPYEAELAFKDKPSQEVIDYVKDNGFTWNGQAKIWTRPIGYTSQAQDRLTAQRTYHEVVDMILAEKGLAPAADRTPF